MNFWEKVKAAAKAFANGVKKVVGEVLTVFREGGETSPWSSKRVVMALAIVGAWKYGDGGIQAAVEIAKTSGSSLGDVLKCCVPLAPFGLCAAIIMLVVLKISAIDIANIARAMKGGQCAD